jgi:hypothetical protein
MFQMWREFWRVVDGFFVPQILGLVVVMVALRFAVRGFNELRRAVRDEHERRK